MEIKTINLVKKGKLLPPKQGVCQECSVDHPPHYPHNAQSMYYQYAFYQKHDRWPTWEDALKHCDEKMRTFWIEQLKSKGIVVQQNEHLSENSETRD